MHHASCSQLASACCGAVVRGVVIMMMLKVFVWTLQRVPIADAIQRITGNPSLRFGFLTAMALTGIWAIQNWSPDSSGTATTQVAEVRQMMTGLLGFMMWKLAVVGVTTVPVPRRQHALDEIV